MVIDLKPEQVTLIDLAVTSGAFHDVGEVVDRAFESIREQLDVEEWLLRNRDVLTAQISVGFGQSERGEVVDGDAAIAMLQKRRLDAGRIGN